MAHGVEFLEEAVLGEHTDPARRIAFDEQALVINFRVGVGAVIMQDGIDDAQEFAGRGDNGALEADFGDEGPVVAVELGTGGAGGGVSALGEWGIAASVSPAGVAGAALAGRWSCCRARCRPRRRGGGGGGKRSYPGRSRIRIVQALGKSIPGMVCRSRRDADSRRVRPGGVDRFRRGRARRGRRRRVAISA